MRFTRFCAGSTVVEVAGSHAIYVSQPSAVAKLIEDDAEGVSKKAVPRILSSIFRSRLR